MRIGLQLPWYDWSDNPRDIAPKLAEIAQAAEAAGFASLWVMDHFFMLPFNSPPFPKANTVHRPGYAWEVESEWTHHLSSSDASDGE
jgi:alkanesulfonate monooxygenase SsuD/methylene tetrahydromethanopterin reductase-like flavin-dependent oxidoreductase (luciferase family)